MNRPAYIVGTAPHWRTRSSIHRLNYAYLLALLPTALAGAIAHSFGSRATELDASFGEVNPVVKVLVVEMGLDAGVLWFFGILGTLAFAMGAGVLAEYLCQLALRQPYRATDGHGALMGLLVGLLMPPSVPWWVLFIGILVAIFLGKQIFGGLGGYPMHPAMVGWLILLLSWPHYLNPVGEASIATPNLAAVLATAAGGIGLWIVGAIRIRIPLAVLLGVLVFSLVFRGRLQGGIPEQLFSGHVVLAAFFVATDSTSSPANRLAGWLYGAGIGFMIVLIRAFGIWPDAVPFAVVLMNVLNPLLDRLRPRVKRLAIET